MFFSVGFLWDKTTKKEIRLISSKGAKPISCRGWEKQEKLISNTVV
jgi:hypothetical protein